MTITLHLSTQQGVNTRQPNRTQAGRKGHLFAYLVSGLIESFNVGLEMMDPRARVLKERL